MQNSGLRRLAAHYICLDRVYRMHYLVLDREDRLLGIFPLTEEEEATVFYNGILWVLPEGAAPERIGRLLAGWQAGSLPDCSGKEIPAGKCGGTVAGSGLKSCLDVWATRKTSEVLFPDLFEKKSGRSADTGTFHAPVNTNGSDDESFPLPVGLYWQRSFDFPPSEFGAYYGSGNSYIQRL